MPTPLDHRPTRGDARMIGADARPAIAAIVGLALVIALGYCV